MNFITKITETKSPTADDIILLKKYVIELVAENDTNIDKKLPLHKKKWRKNILIKEIKNVSLFIKKHSDHD